MPIYEYECAACGAHHEFIQKFSEGPKRKCPSCGKLRLRKQISAAAFHLKGDGWYVTDFRDKGKTDSAESAGDSKPDAKPSDAKSSDSKTSDSKTGSKAKTDGGGSGGSSRAA